MLDPIEARASFAQALHAVPMSKLASDAGVAVSTVARVRALKHDPSFTTVLRLARAAEIDLAAVLLGVREKNVAPCGHGQALPRPGAYEVTCSACGRTAEWKLVPR